MYVTEYDTGIAGKLTLGADEKGLCGSWFNNDRYYLTGIDEPLEKKTTNWPYSKRPLSGLIVIWRVRDLTRMSLRCIRGVLSFRSAFGASCRTFRMGR